MPSSVRRISQILGTPKRTALRVGVYEITPEIAAELLGVNENFRRQKKSAVDGYERDMLLGHWSLTGEPIIIDKHGKMKNGQNRCQGCINAGKPFTTVVVVGVEPETELDMDSGAKRLFSDYLAHLGHSDTSTLAASIRLTYQIIELREVTQNTTGMTNEELRGWFKRGHEGLVDDLERVAPVAPYLPKAYTKTIAASLRHAAAFVEGVDIADVDAYHAKLVMGEDTINRRSVEWQVHEAFRRVRQQSKSGRVQQPIAAAMAINGLNAFLLGPETTASQIYWERGGRNPEPFPAIAPSPAKLARLIESTSKN